MLKRVLLKSAELCIASALIALGVTAFEMIPLWIAMRRDRG
jgi:hypothetical protein